MTDTSKKLIIGSMAAAGLVALMALSDLIIGVPFAGYSVLMDILFLIGAAMVGYLGWDAYQDLR